MNLESQSERFSRLSRQRIEGQARAERQALRDQIAIAAMQGILARTSMMPRDRVASEAYAQADAMLAARDA